MGELSYITVKQLAYKIKGTSNVLSARFAFLLGAGASRQSGIITASEMIRFFKERIIAECCPDNLQKDVEKEAWLKEQVFYKQEGSKYSKLFEQYEPKEIGRQRYIEHTIEGKAPSFGYMVLANLMASNYINTVITTNFDDLVYSACTSYTDIRPIVFAYGIPASEIRITAPRPKIFKLHGDYLYSALKNIDRETMVQDPNMALQVSQVLSEYGLVVVGYSGEDKSVMDILSQISERNDLYWCILRGTIPNKTVQDLLMKKGGFLIEIAGFDEMMNEIGSIVGYNVGAMIGSIQKRQDQMIEQLKSFPTQYYAKILPEVVVALKQQLHQQENQVRKIEALDYFSRATEAHAREDLQQAEELYRKAIKANPSDVKAYNNLYLVYMGQGKNKYDEAIATCQEAIVLEPNNAVSHNDLGWVYLLKGDLFEAEQEIEKAISLNSENYNYVSNLGLVRALQEGREGEARGLWQKGLALCQGNELHDRLYRALYTLAIGEEEHGLTEMQKILAQDKPPVSFVRFLLEDGKILAQSSKPPSGIEKMLEILQAAIHETLSSLTRAD